MSFRNARVRTEATALLVPPAGPWATWQEAGLARAEKDNK